MAIKAFVFDAYGTLYDVQSIATAVEKTFPTHGETITQVWRMKQLEYSWLRTLMHRFEDFRAVTRDSLTYTLQVLGLPADPITIDRLVAAYDHLTPYPEAAEILSALQPHRRAIFSNGSQVMLDALVRNTGLEQYLDAVISIDAAHAFKPDPRAYALIEQRLGVQPSEVMFVTSNGFDAAGARAFGFNVARVARVPQTALHQELASPIGISAFYRALRTQNEILGEAPTHELASLRDLSTLARWCGGSEVRHTLEQPR